MLEIKDRDGMARITIFEVNDKKVETPVLMPVINPLKSDLGLEIMKKYFDLKIIITNSYIIYKNQQLKDTILQDGIHKVLGYNGIIMTDSGAFQQHQYGEIDVSYDEIFSFQLKAGVDLPTVLDLFSEPYDDYDTVLNKIKITEERTKRARELAGDRIIVAPVQGGVYPDLRRIAAESQSQPENYLAIGGVVPLMESYKFGTLADVILSVKETADPSLPVHLFGAGHPIMFAMAAFLGVDFFDSSSYIKYAYEHKFMYIDGTRSLEELDYLPCVCPICTAYTPKELKKLTEKELVEKIALHNLYVSFKEIELVKQNIKEGTLWELVTMRAKAHPNFMDIFNVIRQHREVMEYYEPVDRRSFSLSGYESYYHPAITRSLDRVLKNTKKYIECKDKEIAMTKSAPSWGGGLKYENRLCNTPLGIIPSELLWSYPFNAIIYSEKYFDRYDIPFWIGTFNKMVTGMAKGSSPPVEWEYRRCGAILDYQFGEGASALLSSRDTSFIYSKNTGRLRMIKKENKHILSLRNSGFFNLKIDGAILMNKILEKDRYRVTVSDDAVDFVSKGYNLFAKFVVSADKNIHVGDEVIVIDGSNSVIACGTSFMTPIEMQKFKRGICVKIREGIFKNRNTTEIV